ncbi:acetyl-CoA synthetase-like protein [Penicillium malachiteum]|uniref:Acetyl-CoA synthetase-like protein n=1 Tax=Penicillium malachiteum TaxID=1324776 RepID=A0AAD6HLN6_9EURO|nr:acetyl-CoA synthetase-like protein [Penicillium malachiteum]
MHFQLPVSNGLVTCECSTELAEHKSSLDIGSTTPISVFLPLSYLRAESALLSAWAVLMKGYYMKQTVSFLQFTKTDTDESPRETFKSESISIDLDWRWRENAGVESNPYAVCFLKQEDNASANEREREICDLVNASQVCLLLVAKWTEGERISLNILSYRDGTCGLELCSLLDSLRKILESIVYYPFTILKDIEIISNYDLFRLKEWMNIDPPKPASTIHGLVNRHYFERPAQIAISSTSREFTYEELGKLSFAMAQMLRDHGVHAGDIVGFCVEKSALSIIVLLAILRAGACYLPMATSTPVSRLENMIQSAGIKVLVTENEVVKSLRQQPTFDDVRMITPASLEEINTVSTEWCQEVDLDPSQLAYIMFTSGSTGQPKGVANHHGAVSGSLQAVNETFGLSTSTKFLQYASFSFDASICELFAPLVVGGTVCIPSESERIEDLAGVMEKLNVTDASLTPSIVATLKPENLPTLRHLYIGGEAPTAAIVEKWANKVRLSNIYGLTEGGVWDTVELNVASTDNPKAIGRGIGANCWIVDPENVDRLQPIGVEGEVLLQSPYLAERYLDDTLQSSNAFRPLPKPLSTLTEPFQARCYQTGDLARWQADGKLIFTGRRSGFVKIRGLRVDLGEIETAMRDCIHDQERVAVILAGEGKDHNNPELVAFVEQKVGENTGTSLADKISVDLKNILPSYMIPSAFVPVSSMPLTDAKKIHRQQLIADWANMSLSEKVALRPGSTPSQTWPQIDPANQPAIELSSIIADLVDAGGDLRGWDFPIASAGLGSIQTVYLSGEIRRLLGGSMHFHHLQQPGITVCQIVEQLSGSPSKGSDGLSDTRIPRDLLSELDSIKIHSPIHSPRTKTIFATSVTGFLGSQVLRVLLEDSRVGRIVGLVRSDDEEEARDKIRAHAQLGQWWNPEFDTKIEVWLGDLSLPKLGLDDIHWLELTGNMQIDGIIHNGARVNWLDDFSTLKSTNVDSTGIILEALSNMSTPCPFTYVGGGYLPPPKATREQICSDLAHACGYDQTKFLSRMMLEKYNHQLDQGLNPSVPRGRVIQPGYLAGTRWEGIAHPEDFLWRLAYSILSLGILSVEMQNAHIPIAGVEQVAFLVVDSVLNPRGEQAIDCHDGVSLGVLCGIISQQSGRSIKLVAHDKWIMALRDDVESNALNHPFLPVLDWFEANLGHFMAPTPVTHITLFDQKDTIAALDKSIRYLLDIGFLRTKSGATRFVDEPKTPRFQRSNKNGSYCGERAVRYGI